MRLTCIAAAVLLTVACSPALKVTIDASTKTTCDLSVSIDGQIAAQLAALAGGMQQTDSVPIFDLAAIQTSLKAAGFSTASVMSPSAGTLNVHATAPSTDAAFGTVPHAVRYSDRRLEITVSAATRDEILSLLPETTAAYIDLLFAPLFTGETMTEAEYLAIVAGVYGQDAAALLKKGLLTITFALPAAVTVQTAPKDAVVKTEGKTAVITLPLTAALTTRDALVFRVAW